MTFFTAFMSLDKKRQMARRVDICCNHICGEDTRDQGICSGFVLRGFPSKRIGVVVRKLPAFCCRIRIVLAFQTMACTCTLPPVSRISHCLLPLELNAQQALCCGSEPCVLFCCVLSYPAFFDVRLPAISGGGRLSSCVLESLRCDIEHQISRGKVAAGDVMAGQAVQQVAGEGCGADCILCSAGGWHLRHLADACRCRREWCDSATETVVFFATGVAARPMARLSPAPPVHT